MMTREPAVSVILPVYNGERYLSAALESIIQQSFSDFELIAIDDGSQDDTLSILKEWRKRDDRLRLINRANRGLVETLNEAVSLARGRYIARMDADDVSMQDRLKFQVEYLDRNPDVVLLGVSVTKSFFFRWKFPGLYGKRISTWGLAFRNNIGHPGVMVRTSVLRDNNLCYSQDYKHAEDFKLWCEVIRYGYADVLPRTLLYYRVHAGSVSAINRRAQAQIDRKIVMENLAERFDVDMSSYFQLDVRSWIKHLTERLFRSHSFRSLPVEDRQLIYRTYQEYCAGFGVGTFLHYIRVVGVRNFLNTGPRVPICLYRALKRQARKEWMQLEI